MAWNVKLQVISHPYLEGLGLATTVIESLLSQSCEPEGDHEQRRVSR